jgi:hypothetical protein
MTLDGLPKVPLVSPKAGIKHVTVKEKTAKQLPLRITEAFLWYNLPPLMEKDSAGRECTLLRARMVMTILISSTLKET